MGNRAIITVSANKAAPAVYLHWNGGPESVLAFLEAAKQLKVRDPEGDPEYFLARFGQIVANFFGDTTSVGYGLAHRLDGCDNGRYVIGAGFKIVSRQYGGPKALDELGPKETEKYQNVLAETLKFNAPIFADR